MVSVQRRGKRIGYVRVSSTDQNTARQLDGVQLDKKYIDYASGKDTNRPQLQLCLDYVRDEDILVVHSMDRLARSLSDLLSIVERLTQRGVAVEFIKENLTFNGEDSPISKLMLSIIGATSEFERALIRERQREGIAKAKEVGRYRGRQSTISLATVQAIRDRVTAGANKAALAREYGLSRQTVYNLISV
jgi:DNA invertase Pin-like site-specific DNA recombinase